MMNQSEFVLVRGTALLLSAVLFVTLVSTSDSANDALQSPANVNCTCPGEVLTFICIINEGGTTLWTGTAFSCNLNEILLRHSQFSLPGGTSGSCNNGAITGRSIGVTNGCYSSELNVTISPNLNGRTILCNHDGTTQRNIGSSTLNIVTAMDPPSSVQLVGIQNGQAQFRWTPIDSCTPVHYAISTNCSSQCSPMTADQTTTSCPVSEPTTDVVVCDFSVQSVVCGNLMGDLRTAVIIFQAQASSVNLIPHYLANNKSLSKFTILGRYLTIALSDGSPIFIREYRVSYTDPTTGSVLHSTTVSSCGNDSCDTDVTLPSPSLVPVCPPSASTVDITVMADTGFGQRPLSDPITTGCKNMFVDVQYNFSSSTFTCNFLNQMDTSMKYCSVVYGDCDQRRNQSAQGNSTPGAPNTVTLSVMSSDSLICYSTEASNGSFTLVVEGRVQSTMTENVTNTATVIMIAVLVPAIIVIITIIAVLVVVILCRQKMHKGAVGQREYHGLQQTSIIDQLRLEPINEKDRKFRKHTVQSNCRLKDAIDFQLRKATFKRGHVYYEFTHDIENVSKEKELIFVEKKTGKYYISTADSSVLQQCGLIGEGVKRPTFENYRMFVQSTGSGARHLPINSTVLYEQKQEREWKPEDAPLVPITSNHFVVSKVKHECTVEEFCKERDLEPSRANLHILLEFNSVDKTNIVKGITRDVILMDKAKGTLFTGPVARSDPSVHEAKWRVFILANYDDKTPLIAGSLVIHQNPDCMEAYFHVLYVDEDNVQMSEFVKRALGVTEFENGRAYYEFTQTEEDLVSYKEVVRMHKSVASKYKDEQKKKKQGGEKQKKQSGEEQSQDRGEELLQTGMKWFYWIGAPGVGIKPKNYDNYKVFVQSTSQGSRCLKSKTLLLYKVQNNYDVL